MVNILRRNKNGALEMDELGKIILMLIGLAILIYIIMVVIRGDVSSQSDNVNNIVSGL